MEKTLTTNGTFITPKIGKASQLGVSLFEDNNPVEIWPGASLEEIEIVIKAVYRQVLGNAYVMESERLQIPESQLKQGEITVKEFVRQVAKSELYRSRFFENCPRYRSIELNFKHLLGRAPEGYQETQQHSQILDEKGFSGEIDSYIDSLEYQLAYGEYIVPYYRGYKTQTGKKMVGFTYMFQLLRGASSSDKDLTQNNRTRLARPILTNSAAAVVPPSQIGLVGQTTDVNDLLARVFQKSRKAPPVKSDREKDLQYKNLQSQCQERAEQIKNLQQKITQARSLASIGQIQLNKWQSKVSSVNSTTSELSAIDPNLTKVPQEASLVEMESLAREQDKAIAILEKEIARLQSIASIGETQLNKWRNRIFK